MTTGKRLSWIDRSFPLENAVLVVRHFGTESYTAHHISTAVNAIIAEYGLNKHDTPATMDHGSNVLVALWSKIRLDCLCHRLHTILETRARRQKMPTRKLRNTNQR